VVQRPPRLSPAELKNFRLKRRTSAVFVESPPTPPAFESDRRLRVEYVSIDSLQPDAKNPRLHTDRQIQQIARSIKSFGFNVPILADRLRRVVAGHGRLLAARLLGLEEVPVIQLESLTEPQARAFALADNRMTDQSQWSDQLLSEVFRDLSALELNFSLEDTGFTMGEIDFRIEGSSTSPAGHSDPADQLPEHSNQPAVSKRGCLWILGRHRLLCGDACDAASYDALMQGNLAQLVFTDPPYNVPVQGHVSGKGRIKHREFVKASGELTFGQFVHFLAGVMHLLARHSGDGSLHFQCMDWRHSSEILAAGNQAYTELKNICVWVKDNAGMGSLYRSQHELVFVFKSGRGPHRNNVELGVHGRNRSNVWKYPSPSSFGRQSEEGQLLALHPTVKPVAMIADAILDASARGDVVLDPFLGSGSTLVAAERVGRICYGIEIDPLYADTAIRRWQRYTGEAAVHAVSGRRFDELATQSVVRRA